MFSGGDPSAMPLMGFGLAQIAMSMAAAGVLPSGPLPPQLPPALAPEGGGEGSALPPQRGGGAWSGGRGGRGGSRGGGRGGSGGGRPPSYAPGPSAYSAHDDVRSQTFSHVGGGGEGSVAPSIDEVRTQRTGLTHQQPQPIGGGRFR